MSLKRNISPLPSVYRLVPESGKEYRARRTRAARPRPRPMKDTALSGRKVGPKSPIPAEMLGTARIVTNWPPDPVGLICRKYGK
jgi:hypothetical protein